MKILFTGGATGGHFYPIIAVAEAIEDKVIEKRLLKPKLYFMAPTKYNPRALFDHEIEFVYVPAGKIRRYFSILNFTDFFKTASGVLIAIVKMYMIYPDIVFGKGGYGSFPALLAAKLLRIPVVIHESDSGPGRVNAWAGKFAKRIAISYPSAANYFKKSSEKAVIAFTGSPVRKEVSAPLTNGAHEFLNLENDTPVILVIGGSQGAQSINDTVLDALPELVKKYQIIHQTGRKNFDTVKDVAKATLKDSQFAYRYHPFDYLNDLAMRMSAGAADIVVSRAGSSIFEIALWKKPSIIIPLPTSISHDQTGNAFDYAKTGAAIVIEENNLTSHILVAEIDRIMANPHIRELMSEGAASFAKPDAAAKIAEVILDLSLEHES
ncbi:MAG: UDP-N-acetylglucosamine--N-acetylmuramyl-(pentapeptide) pyrophosphoryl-undecaprenol N-acetylglucosamine transferase [Candidatus Pacebacteria bacterium]|nr:UDP-N-acetylglucosamine--N-acetylmuramyl-(pentapeptide) pyrophosphoryl-undecaprenol N-acetylglucosamine transferase [Candidatus Paceibacterota bacterium]